MRYPLPWIALSYFVATVFIISPAQVVAAESVQQSDLMPVKKWLARMAGMESIEAAFVQQKYLRTLRRPLTTKGHIWIQYPDDFRWELGDPAATVAVRSQDILTLLEPKKKRAKRYFLVEGKGKSSAAVSAAIDSASKTFPRSMEELEKHFEILGLRRAGEVYELTLKPKDKSLTAAMRKVLFFIDAKKFHLRAFEIQLRDKSRVRTTFTWIKFNPKISVNLLNPDLSGYKLKE